MRRIGLSVVLVLAVSQEAFANYVGFTIEELVASSDTVVVARRKGPEKVVARSPLRYRTLVVVKEVWKGANVPKEVAVEYELGEGVPQLGPFGTKRDFVAFLTRLPRSETKIPVFELRLGNDSALLIPGPNDLCTAKNLVEPPIGMEGGARWLDLRWLKSHVGRVVRSEGKTSAATTSK